MKIKVEWFVVVIFVIYYVIFVFVVSLGNEGEIDI